jgi:hypothetical protein
MFSKKNFHGNLCTKTGGSGRTADLLITKVRLRFITDEFGKKNFCVMPVSSHHNSKYSRHFPQNRFKFDGLTTVPLNFLPLPCLFVKSLYL